MRNSLWFIKGIDVLSELNPSVLDTISRAARIDRFPSGQIFSLPNAPAFSVYIVRSGRLKYVRLLQDDTEGISMDIVRGEILGWIPADESRPHPYYLTSVEDIVFWVLSKTDFQRFFIVGSPGVAFRAYTGGLGRTRIENAIWSLMYTDIPARIASLLLTAGKAKLVPRHVAHLTGVTIDPVLLTLAGFVRRGYIEIRKGRITPRSREALAAVAGRSHTSSS